MGKGVQGSTTPSDHDSIGDYTSPPTSTMIIHSTLHVQDSGLLSIRALVTNVLGPDSLQYARWH